MGKRKNLLQVTGLHDALFPTVITDSISCSHEWPSSNTWVCGHLSAKCLFTPCLGPAE